MPLKINDSNNNGTQGKSTMLKRALLLGIAELIESASLTLEEEAEAIKKAQEIINKDNSCEPMPEVQDEV